MPVVSIMFVSKTYCPLYILYRGLRTSNKYHNRSDNLFEVNKTLTDIIDLYNNGNLHDCRTLICTLKYANIIELGGLAKLNVSKASLTEKRCLVIVIDLCNHYKSRSVSYLNFRSNKYKVNDNHKPHNKYSEFVPIKFVSKELEDIDLNSILNDSEAMKYFSSKHLSKKFKNEEFRFSTCYKYEQSIRCDIINYECNIIDNGPIDDVKCFCHLYPDFINSSLKFSLNLAYFDGWKALVINKFKGKILNVSISCKRNQSIFKSESKDVNLLKEHFIMSGVDKAQNNISFTCRYYYLKNLDDELSSTNTYVISDKSENDIVKDHVKFCNKYDISVNDFNLPFMHMIPQFHKPTLDFRYIAAGTKCSTKPLAKILTGVFKLIDRTIKYSNNFQFKFKDTSGY